MSKSLRRTCGAVLMVVAGAVIAALAAFADVMGELSAAALMVGVVLMLAGVAPRAPAAVPYDWEVMG